MTDINHILRVPIFLRENIRIIASLTILAWAVTILFWQVQSPGPVTILFWQVQSPGPVTGWGVASWIGAILGLILGRRASQSLVAQPIGAAFGVAWRISFVWVVLAALAENGKGEIQSAPFTMPFFPSLLVAFIGVIAGGFILGYLAHTLWSGVSRMSLQEIMRMLATLLGAIAASIVIFQFLWPSNSREVQQPEAKQSEQREEQNKQEL